MSNPIMNPRISPSVEAVSFLGKCVSAKIDRPLGSKHPEWDIIYPINYGCIPGVFSPDSEEMDAYILGISEPVESFTGHCIAVIHRLDDLDDKLVLAPESVDFSEVEIVALTDFQERFFTSIILRQEQSN